MKCAGDILESVVEYAKETTCLHLLYFIQSEPFAQKIKVIQYIERIKVNHDNSSFTLNMLIFSWRRHIPFKQRAYQAMIEYCE